MGKYIKEFSNHTEYEEFVDQVNFDLQTPNISLCNRQNEVHYSPYEKHDYSQDYLTFEIVKDGTLIWNLSNSRGSYTKSIQYSIDNGTTWTTITSSYNNTTPFLNATKGQRILFKGSNFSYATIHQVTYTDGEVVYYEPFNHFKGTAYFNVYGNIKSMLNNASTLQYGSELQGLFSGSNVLNAENLILPYKVLSNRCYKEMFSGCTFLKKSPKLIATTLDKQCYHSMFRNCTSLTTVPLLSVTTLAESCYSFMFRGCTSLTEVPTLPATTLADNCYESMFSWCTNLITVPETLPATTLAEYCYSSMFEYCTNLITTPTLPATTLTRGCYYRMFSYCKSLTTAPVLPATTLTIACYSQMFSECENLNNIKCLATDISATNCTFYWVDGVASSGTFTKASSMSSWSSGDYGIPSGWTVQTATS